MALCLPLMEIPWLYNKNKKAVAGPVLLLHLDKKKQLGVGHSGRLMPFCFLFYLPVPHELVPVLLTIESQNVTVTKKTCYFLSSEER